MRALEHYTRRLRTVGASPELESAAMFSQIVLQEARKKHPEVAGLLSRMRRCLGGASGLGTLEKDIPVFVAALESYNADMLKARDSRHEYYQRLVDASRITEDEMAAVRTALKKIRSYAE